jgi:glycogen(starch) synthase
VSGPGGEAVVPQHLVIVLPTTGEFDSRTYRIATSCVARGHRVTVLARAADGLPRDEVGPGGYRIIRVAVDAIDGLPAAGLWRRLRTRRRRSSDRSAGGPGPVAVRDGPPSGTGPGEPESGTTAGNGRASRGPLDRITAAGRAAIRIAAIGLTVRAQVSATRAVDPGGDLYHAMAYMGIPVALALGGRNRSPVIYDARDIYLEARNLARLPRPARWLVARAERGWAGRSSRVVTVNRAYAEVLEERLRVPLPLIVMNCSFRYQPAQPAARRFHDRFGLAAERNVILYHGGLFPERGIEQLISALADVSAADLVLMGYGALEADLPRLIAASPAANRIHVMRAVPPDELHDWVAAADIVAMPIQPSTLNHRLTTPNKLFEAMAAGVPVVVSDLPGMAAIVTATGCGVLCDPTDPASIARAIRAILDAPADARRAFAERARRAADETYNWETQATILLAEYGRLTGRAW